MTARQLRRVTVGMLMAMTLAAGTAAVAGTIERVNAFQTDVWQARVSVGVPVTVTVDGDGDTDLDLYVYDSNGTLVAIWPLIAFLTKLTSIAWRWSAP